MLMKVTRRVALMSLLVIAISIVNGLGVSANSCSPGSSCISTSSCGVNDPCCTTYSYTQTCTGTCNANGECIYDFEEDCTFQWGDPCQ